MGSCESITAVVERERELDEQELVQQVDRERDVGREGVRPCVEEESSGVKGFRAPPP